MGEITVCEVKSLWHKYPGQNREQDCYVELTEKGELSASWDGIVGSGTPMPVWHGRTRRWGIECLRTEVAEALLEEITPLAQRVHDGLSIRWDGSNHVGVLDDDAREASDEIAALIERRYDDESQREAVWEAADWLAPLGSSRAQCRELGIYADTTDEELAAIVTAQDEIAERERVTVHDLEGACEFLRDWAREEDFVQLAEGWEPTHKIEFRAGHNPPDTVAPDGITYVMLDDDGPAYTRVEWEATEKASWSVNDDGEWLCQGQATPGGCPGTVTVTEL